MLRKLSKRDRRRVLRKARARTWFVRVLTGRQSRRYFRRLVKVGTWAIPELNMAMEVAMSRPEV